MNKTSIDTSVETLQLFDKTYFNYLLLTVIFSVIGPAEIVAFCAYMTTAEENPNLNHVYVFDNVKSNTVSAYGQDSGMFTAPSD